MHYILNALYNNIDRKIEWFFPFLTEYVSIKSLIY